MIFYKHLIYNKICDFVCFVCAHTYLLFKIYAIYLSVKLSLNLFLCRLIRLSK